MLGYKVMRYDPVTNRVISGANSRLSYPAIEGSTMRMPGIGVWLSLDKQYVLDNYRGHDHEVLLTVSFDPDDIVRGNITDKQSEFTVPSCVIEKILRLPTEDEEEHIVEAASGQKQFYVVVPLAEDAFTPKGRIDTLKELVNHKLDGILGISDNNVIIMQWINIRDAVVIMDEAKVLSSNDIEEVKYNDPDYLVKDGMAAMYRLYDRKDRSRRSAASVMARFWETLVGGKILHVEVYPQANKFKELAHVWESLQHKISEVTKRYPDGFRDQQEIDRCFGNLSHYGLTSLEENERLLDEMKSYHEVAGWEKSGDYASNKLDRIENELERISSLVEEPDADEQVLEQAKYRLEEEQVQLVVDVLALHKEILPFVSALKSTAEQARSQMTSDKQKTDDLWALKRLSVNDASEKMAEKADDITTVSDLIAAVKDVAPGVQDSTLKELVPAALQACAKPYSDEYEWVVKDKVLNIPNGSKVVIRRSPDSADRRAYLEEAGKALKGAGYKVSFVDNDKFSKAVRQYQTKKWSS
jgi:hypothetical protein